MASVNSVVLLGNLTRDPELRYTASGVAVANFGLAVNDRVKQGDEWKEVPCFVDITVFGRTAENCSENCKKGRQVLIEGRLHFRQWNTPEGQKRNKLEVIANRVQFLAIPRSAEPDRAEADEQQFAPAPNAPASGDIPF